MDTTISDRSFLKADRWEEWRNSDTNQRLGVPPPPYQKAYPAEAALIDLVSPRELTCGQMPLIQTIGRRRSRREYTAVPLSLEELSFLLWATQGIDEDDRRTLSDHAGAPSIPLLRTVPSGGARHPFETYNLIQRVEGLKPGLYRYLSVEHKLLLLASGAELIEKAAAAFTKWVLDAAVLFVWTTIPDRTEWRYSFLAPKLIAQESGHICQNLYLACEAIGAGTCAIGAYDQDRIDALLGVDGTDEFTVYVAPIGKVDPAP